METNIKRLATMIDTLAEMNDSPGNGITRFSYGGQDARAREYLISLAEDMGLTAKTDAVGNVFIRLPGSDPSLPAVLAGSHIDSVRNGGRFDGVVGSVGALEAVLTMVENGYQPKNTIDVVFYAEEEGSNFQMVVMGSKTLVGKLTIDDWKKAKTADGKTAYDVLQSFGLHPEDIPSSRIHKGEVKASLELHIEQSVRLDMEHHTIGIIEGIAGLNWLKITLTGVSNHAGATPMYLRNDPMAVAGKVICDIGSIARQTSTTAVATVGHIGVEPNIPNAIPREVCLTVDIRDIEKKGIDAVTAAVEASARQHAAENGVACKIESIATSEPIKIPAYLIEAMEKNAQALGLDYILMPSGAVHDSNYMAEVTDVGMIFVPSIDGRSHVPEENTDIRDIKAGADLLLATLVSLTA